MRVRKLQEIIQEANEGQILLPNFQREYTYSRSEQKSLITSVFCGIPIGSVLMLTGRKKDFHSREIGRKSTVETTVDRSEVQFLLDGQQRISTLWNAMTDIYEGADDADQLFEEVHNYLKSRWFVKFRLDEKYSDDPWGLKSFTALEHLQQHLVPEEIEEFIYYPGTIVKGNPMNWKGGLNLPKDLAHESSASKSYKKFLDENWCMPIHLMFQSQHRRAFIRHFATRRKNEIELLIQDWKSADGIDYQGLDGDERELLELVAGVKNQADWMEFDHERAMDNLQDRIDAWVDSVNSYFQLVSETKIGVIELDQSYLKKAHVVFDVINKSGVKLSSFDLFCATKPGIDVRKEVNERVPNRFGLKDESTGLINTEYTIQLMNLLRVVRAHAFDEIKLSVLKEDHIFNRMDSGQLEQLLPQVINSLTAAYDFLHERCGIRKLSELPYKLQVLPIAFLIYRSKSSEIIADQLRYFYWLSNFSGRYRESQSQRVARDLEMIGDIEFNESGKIIWPCDYKVDGESYKKILDDPGYNDADSLAPLSGDIDEYRSSVTKSILQFVLSLEPPDFPPNSDERLTSSSDLEIHHVLPIASTKFKSISESAESIRNTPNHILNSPLNKAYISKASNRAIGAMSFVEYEKHMKGSTLEEFAISKYPGAAEVDSDEILREWLRERHSRLQGKARQLLKVWSQ